MSYQRFRKPKTDLGPATLATTATIWSESNGNVAEVAGVAAPNTEYAADNVANVAGVAGTVRDFADAAPTKTHPTDTAVSAAEWEERAAILEYDEGLPRDEAERLAKEQVSEAATWVAAKPKFTGLRMNSVAAETGLRSDPVFQAAESYPPNLFAAGVCAPKTAPKPQDDSLPLRRAGWLPERGPGIRILRPGVEVPADEYDQHLDTLIAARPTGSAERNGLAFAKRKGWCVERSGERIFTRGRA